MNSWSVAREVRTAIMVALAIVVATVVVGLLSLLDARRPVGDQQVATSTTAAPIPMAAAARATTIDVSSHPRSSAMAELNARGGTTCFFTLKRFKDMDPERLDREIASVGGSERWLAAGESWIGTDPEAVVEAFGASWAAMDSTRATELWVIVERDGAEIGLQLRAIRTPGGFTLWRAADTVAARPCRQGD